VPLAPALTSFAFPDTGSRFERLLKPLLIASSNGKRLAGWDEALAATCRRADAEGSNPKPSSFLPLAVDARLYVVACATSS
jgi:hypothetical protein